MLKKIHNTINILKFNSKKNEKSHPYLYEAKEELEKTFSITLYHSQLLAAISMIEGNITEIDTGQGKTYVTFLAATHKAKSGEKVFIATSNEYLAERDCELLKALYERLDLKVGLITSKMDPKEKKETYQNSNVIYGTLTEYGFDILKNGLSMRYEDVFFLPKDGSDRLKGLDFLIIDEIDYTLLDEATTAIILSEPDNQSTSRLVKLFSIAKKIKNLGLYEIEYKNKRVEFEEASYRQIEKLLVEEGLVKDEEDLYHENNVIFYSYIESALSSLTMYERDVDYIVVKNDIQIIDENSGRIGEGRQFGDGLHQFLQLKEGLMVTPETKVKSKITYSNLVKMFSDFTGTSGTILSEHEEMEFIYNKNVIRIEPDKKVKKKLHKDELYESKSEMNNRVLKILKSNNTQRPVLIVVRTIEDSLGLNDFLVENEIKTNVLNAKNVKEENEIIKNAGQNGAITISTAMAGRGTDIRIGSSSENEKEINDNGGLLVIIYERNLSRRIDNQVAGRTGRNGSNGEVYYLSSLSNELFKVIKEEKRNSIFKRLSKNSDVSSVVTTKIIAQLQNGYKFSKFDIRKNDSQYDSEILNNYFLLLNYRLSVLKKLNDISIEDNDGFIKYLDLESVVDHVLNIVTSNEIAHDKLTAEPNEAIKSFIDLECNIDLTSWTVADNDKKREILFEELNSKLNARFIDYLENVGMKHLKYFLTQYDLMELDEFWGHFLSISDVYKKNVEFYKMSNKKPFYEYQKLVFSYSMNYWNNIRRIEFYENILKLRFTKK
jgi:preprotein translocase subunit SecA